VSIPGVVEHDQPHPLSSDVPRPVRIMHFTHISNIPGIFEANELRCFKDAKHSQQADISDPDMQKERARKIIPVTSAGELHEYVPFYFAELSPMLYRRTDEYGRIPQAIHQPLEFVYLVVLARDVLDAGLQYVFTDRHPISPLANFYNQPAEIGRVDWRVMRSPIWKNDPTRYPDRRTRRMAEFLVRGSLPWSLVAYLVVHNAQVASKIETLIKSVPKQIHVNPQWYYRKFPGGQIRVDFGGARR
jgi:ssDNA thymidine ADP-ribosyltransferase, DarT